MLERTGCVEAGIPWVVATWLLVAEETVECRDRLLPTPLAPTPPQEVTSTSAPAITTVGKRRREQWERGRDTS
jgi:hypothetical protein